MKKEYISTILYSLAFCFLVVYIAAYPGEAFGAALEGLKLWFNSVCPALLPFFICIEVLIGLGIVRLLGSTFKPLMRPVFNVPGEGSFGFFMSIASGYPVGSKITARLRQEKICTLQEGQRLLSLCSTSGPLFIIGAVATGILKRPELGFLLAVSHYFSAITSGFLMRFYGRNRTPNPVKTRINPFSEMMDCRRRDGRSIGMLLGDAVKNGVNLILMIGGFIILFAVITRILKLSGLLPLLSRFLCGIIPFVKVDPETVSSLLVGILEVTNGIKECASLQVPIMSKIAIASFMMGFGGLSVNAQVLSIISETDLKFGIYLLMKFVQGIAASFYSLAFFKWFGSAQVFNLYDMSGTAFMNEFDPHRWSEIFISSSINLAMILAFVFLMGIAANAKRIKRL